MIDFQHQIHIRKESLKFSAAHMTVFPDGSKESLHGHNYFTEISIQLNRITLSDMLPFSELKQSIKEICDLWDEKVLIARNCPFLKIEPSSEMEAEFRLCGKRYVLPQDEVIFLPLENITSETLAEEFSRRLIQKLDPKRISTLIEALEVRIEESPGQGSTCSWKASRVPSV